MDTAKQPSLSLALGPLPIPCLLSCDFIPLLCHQFIAWTGHVPPRREPLFPHLCIGTMGTSGPQEPLLVAWAPSIQPPGLPASYPSTLSAPSPFSAPHLDALPCPPPCGFIVKSVQKAVRAVSPIHPKFLQAGHPSPWPWSGLHGTHSSAHSGWNAGTATGCFSHRTQDPKGRAVSAIRMPEPQGNGPLLPSNRFRSAVRDALAPRVLNPACRMFCLPHPVHFLFNC